MKSELARKECRPCGGDVPPMEADAIREHMKQLEEGWKVVEDHHLVREYSFKNFREALEFTNRVGELAEKEGHHPDINLTWGKVRLEVWTHSIDGLSESDFIFAAKTDAMQTS